MKGGQATGTAVAAISLAWRVSRGWMLAIGGLTLLSALLPVAAAWMSKELFDELGKGSAGSPRSAITYALAAAALSAGALVITRLSGYVALAAQTAISHGVDKDLYDKINRFLGLAPFEDPVFRDRIQLAQQAAQQTSQMVTTFGATAAQSVLRIGAFVMVMLAIWPMMAFLLFIAAVPELITQLYLARHRARAAETSARSHRIRGLFQQHLVDVRSAREVRLFGLGDLFRSRMLRALLDAGSVELRSERKSAAAQGELALLGSAVAAAGAVYAVVGVTNGRFTIGDLTFFLAAIGGVQGGLSAIIGQISNASQSLVMFGHYRLLTNETDDLSDGSIVASPLKRGIELRDVWFRYSDDGPWVLRGVSCVIEAGMSIGLVGVNGAGKSTLIKLLCRLYDPQRGQILWDGVDLRDLRAETLRRRVSAIFQDFMAYELSAQHNIGVGKVEHLDDQLRVRAAAMAIGIDSLLSQLPRGYATPLGRAFVESHEDSGVELSGGQWQRVALARSVMRQDADLLILDEPSSGLDASAESHISQRIRTMRRGKTDILISHRLSSIRATDKIVVLSGGRVIEEGDHDQLMSLDGEYAALFTTQASGYQDQRVAARSAG